MNESLCFSRDFVSISWMHGVCFRVSKVVADPDNLLKQSRFIKLGKVREHILLFRTTWNFLEKKSFKKCDPKMIFFYEKK